MWRAVLLFALLGLIPGCMGVKDSIYDALTQQDELWAVAESELLSEEVNPEDKKAWSQSQRMRKARLQLRRIRAALKGEDFDMEEEAKKLGIKKRGERDVE
jgi:hypothetical protein